MAQEATESEAGGDGNEQLIATVLAFIIPGVGQLYQGRTRVAVAFFVADVINIVLSIFLIGILTGFATACVSAYDAYNEWLDI